MTARRGSTAEYAAWLLVLAGLWVLASPLVYADTISGAALNNALGSGVVVTVLAAYVAYAIRRE